MNLWVMMTCKLFTTLTVSLTPCRISFKLPLMFSLMFCMLSFLSSLFNIRFANSVGLNTPASAMKSSWLATKKKTSEKEISVSFVKMAICKQNNVFYFYITWLRLSIEGYYGYLRFCHSIKILLEYISKYWALIEIQSIVYILY